MVSFTNIRLAQKAFTNVLAYLTSSLMTQKKSFIVLTPKVNVIKHFTTVIYKCLLLARMFIPGELFHSSLMLAGKSSPT